MIIICILIIVGVVGLDQLTKWLVMLNMEVGDSVPVIGGVLEIEYTLNYNIVFGIDVSPVVRWIVIIISIISVAAVIFYLFRYKPREWYYYIPLSMITGGGIGNLIDRLFYGEVLGQGGVVDFIDFCAFPKIWSYIFNVADSFVCVGAFFLMGSLIFSIVKEEKAARAAAAAVEPAEENDNAENNG